MKLPKPRLIDRQQRLFDVDKLILTDGEARWATGEFFEQAAADVSGGLRLRTDATCDICPDVRFEDEVYFESKGVGRGAAVLFYESRMEKDARFIAAGHSLVYWFWHHTFPSLQDVLREGLASKTKRLLIVDHDLLRKSVEGRPVRVVNSGYDEAHGEGGTGWTIRLSFFAEQCERLPSRIEPVVHGKHRMQNVEVFVSDPEFVRFVDHPPVQLQLDFGPS